MKLKNIKRKRLNNKGFTLIELLAVVVILAVVMGIAMTSVLSSMNKARGGSLSDTATTIAQAFNTKYTESLVDGIPNAVYNDVSSFGGYNFQSSAIYYIDSKLADTFNISSAAYAIAGSTGTATSITSPSTVANSFVSFDVSTGKFTVCMIANTNGNVFVDNYKVTSDTEIGSLTTPSTDTNITSIKVATDNMIACSDGAKSW